MDQGKSILYTYRRCLFGEKGSISDRRDTNADPDPAEVLMRFNLIRIQTSPSCFIIVNSMKSKTVSSDPLDFVADPDPGIKSHTDFRGINPKHWKQGQLKVVMINIRGWGGNTGMKGRKDQGSPETSRI